MQWVRAQTGGQAGVTLARVAVRERAVVPTLIAEPQELVQRRVRPLVAEQARRERHAPRLVAPAGRPSHWVEDAVDRQRPHLVREQVRVHLPEVRAVRHAVVGELGIPHGLAQEIHVACHVCRGHVVHDRTAVGRARVGESVIGVVPDALVVSGERERHRRLRLERFVDGVEAAERRAAHDAPGVESHQVEPGSHPRGEELVAGIEDLVDPGPTRTTGIEEDRADLQGGVRSGKFYEGERDLVAIRMVVVERHPDPRALEVSVTGVPRGMRHADRGGCLRSGGDAGSDR